MYSKNVAEFRCFRKVVDQIKFVPDGSATAPWQCSQPPRLRLTIQLHAFPLPTNRFGLQLPPWLGSGLKRQSLVVTSRLVTHLLYTRVPIFLNEVGSTMKRGW